jgi:hypothetical protein
MTNLDSLDLATVCGGFAGNDYVRVCAENDRYDGCSGMQQQWQKANDAGTQKAHTTFGPLPKGGNIVHIPGF